MIPLGEQPLLVIAGPTGSGKSELALQLAEAFSGEIVNYDSVQVYRGLDVGSAKLPVEARRGVPHHLIDVADPGSAMTAGAFARRARAVLAEIAGRGRLPILAGGTGFYLRALLHGLSPAPPRDEALRDRLRALAERRPAALSRILSNLDKAAAERIHPNDTQKLIRAVEISVSGRLPASAVQALPRDGLRGYRVLKLGLLPERSALHRRLNDRAEWMFSHGLLREVQGLLAGGLPRDAQPLLSIGYKQAVACLLDGLPVPQAVTECQTRTRQYAKRQITWFRSEQGLHWLAGFGTDECVQRVAVERTREFLASFVE